MAKNMSYADEILAKIRADIDAPDLNKIKRKISDSHPRKSDAPIVDLPGEQWKPIEGFPHYQISNRARIKSTARSTGKLLKIFKITNPGAKQAHFKVTLCHEKQKHLFSIHHLVAEAFCPKPKTKEHLMVGHKDGNNDNNNAENLEWITRHESRLRAFTLYPRENVHYHGGLPAQRNSRNLGGNRSLISNRMNKNGWCLKCASTIPVQKRGKNMQTCKHIKQKLQ